MARIEETFITALKQGGLVAPLMKAAIDNPAAIRLCVAQLRATLMAMEAVPYGISREVIEGHRRQEQPLIMVAGRCAGCGTADYTQAALRDHPSLPTGSSVPLCEHCEPTIY